VLEDPGLDVGEMTNALRTAYGIDATAFAFVPGYDMRAASYDVAALDGRWFAKVRFGSAADAPLEVPRALLDAGVPNVPAPIRTQTSTLWHPMRDDRTLVVYPFVAGRSAMVAGMTADQWRTFGATLRAVHDSDLATRFADRLPRETFALPSAAIVRQVMEIARRPPVASPATGRLSALLEQRAGPIGAMLERAERLGARLGRRPLVHVLCHADIHAANILVTDDGRILLVDWDGPMLAPRERDLLFVIGSRIARDVEPHEAAWFFEGYGDVAVERDALVYYRCERILEDIGEFGRSVFGDPDLPEASRQAQVTLAEGFFDPGGIVESVERG
jgi:spectinomycin phosphotransferase